MSQNQKGNEDFNLKNFFISLDGLFNNINNYMIANKEIKNNIHEKLRNVEEFKKLAKNREDSLSLLIDFLYEFEWSPPFILFPENFYVLLDFIKDNEKFISINQENKKKIELYGYKDKKQIELFDYTIINKEKIEKDLNDLFISFLNEDMLNYFLIEWKKKDFISEERFIILEDVIWAHLNKKYTLSIPTLLPHFEGVLISGNKQENVYSDIKKGNAGIGDIIDSFLDNKLNSHLYYTLRLIIDKTLIKGFKKEDYIPRLSDFNRNTVLHGRNIYYPSEINSLKLIFLFSTLVSLRENNNTEDFLKHRIKKE